MALSYFVGIVIGSVLGACFLAYSLYRLFLLFQKYRLKSIRDHWSKYYAPSVRGNFVRTYHQAIEEEYFLDLEQVIGRGGCGVVVYGENLKTSEPYAIKIVNKATAERNRLDRELKLMKDVDHMNIVRLFCVYDVPKRFYFVMELCTGGHLGDLIARQPAKKLDENFAKVLCRQLISAIAHIHSRGIAHRDIKLQNILMDHSDSRTAQLKLIDFGYGSRFIGALPMKTKCGTPYTTAPEVWRESYDERCDVWSAGVVLYIMLSGKRPFEALNIKGALADAGKAAMVTNILACRYTFNHPQFASVSKEAKQYVQTLLHPDYRSRIYASDALEHPWLKETIEAPATRLRKMSQRSLSSRAINTMLSIRESNEFRQTGMLALAFGVQTTVSAEMRSLFHSFDVDGSGSLSIDEFRNAMGVFAPQLKEDDIRRLFHLIDIDNDKSISYTEFLAATLDPNTIDVEELNRVFDLLDSDGNGYITTDELQNVLIVKNSVCEDGDENPSEIGNVSKSQKESADGPFTISDRVKNMMEKCDIDNDGRISYDEFLWAMTQAEDIFGRGLPSNLKRGFSNEHSPLEVGSKMNSTNPSQQDITAPSLSKPRNDKHEHVKLEKFSNPGRISPITDMEQRSSWKSLADDGHSLLLANSKIPTNAWVGNDVAMANKLESVKRNNSMDSLLNNNIPSDHSLDASQHEIEQEEVQKITNKTVESAAIVPPDFDGIPRKPSLDEHMPRVSSPASQKRRAINFSNQDNVPGKALTSPGLQRISLSPRNTIVCFDVEQTTPYEKISVGGDQDVFDNSLEQASHGNSSQFSLSKKSKSHIGIYQNDSGDDLVLHQFALSRKSIHASDRALVDIKKQERMNSNDGSSRLDFISSLGNIAEWSFSTSFGGKKPSNNNRESVGYRRENSNESMEQSIHPADVDPPVDKSGSSSNNSNSNSNHNSSSNSRSSIKSSKAEFLARNATAKKQPVPGDENSISAHDNSHTNLKTCQ